MPPKVALINQTACIDFTNIINLHSVSTNDLVEEVGTFKEKLSVTKEDQNSLIEELGDLQERLSLVKRKRMICPLSLCLRRVGNMSVETESADSFCLVSLDVPPQ